MKLIYITNARMPTEKAHGIQIMKMCQAFSNQGIETELVVPWRFNEIKKDSFDYYSIRENFRIKKLPSVDIIPLGIPKICFWIQNLTFGLSVFFYLLFKKANYIYSRDLLSLWLLSFFKKNLIYEAHYFPKHFWLYHGILKRIKGLIVITQKLKEFYQKKSISLEKILVAPDGVDLDFFQILENQKECRQRLSLSQDKKIVLYTGHLYEWKGAQVLADASKFLDKDTIIVFVGGTKKDEKEFREKNKALNNISILGHKLYSEIPYYLKAADVLILPNSEKAEISKYWTSPMKMFEYMASQKPIIASDLPSLREILSENNAILVEPDNPRKLTQGIAKVLKNPDFSAKISIQAYQDVQNYSWFKRSKKIIDFLNND